MDRGKKTILLTTILICSFGNLAAQNDSVFNSKTLSSFKLFSSSNGKIFHLPNEKISKDFSLFIFLSPECPLSQNYLPLLNSLKEKYGNTISFYGIIPGKAYTAESINEFAATYSIQFSLLIDSSKSLTKYLQARVTPEVILLNDKNLLVYKGAVNDLLVGLGKRRVKAVNEYLKDAIVRSINNEIVSVKRTRAVGCKINDY